MTEALKGVTFIEGGSSTYMGRECELSPGAELIANWSNGNPLLVEKKDVGPAKVRRIDIAMYPVSSAMGDNRFWVQHDSQMDLLLARTLLYVAGISENCSVWIDSFKVVLIQVLGPSPSDRVTFL